MPSRTSLTISILIAALAAAVSAMGLLSASLYRDNPFVTTTWKGNDAVTLVLGVPILAIAMFFAVRGSLRARLVWLGMLDYMLYNYAFYLFAARFNALFLAYVALFTASIFALLFGLIDLDLDAIGRQFRDRTPVRWIGGYLLFVGLGLTTVYGLQSVAYTITGELPPIVTISEHPTSIVFALDLSLLVPWMILGAIWLIQRRPWGYVIAGIVTVKGALYTIVLTVNSLLVRQAGLAGADELPLWGTLTLMGLTAAYLLYRNMRPAAEVALPS